MNILILNNKKECAKLAASIVKQIIKKKKSATLGLASGNTMIPVYKEILKNKLDFSKVKTFNLDEYYQIKDQRKSMHAYMEKNLFSKSNLKKENALVLDSQTKNPKKECASYESKIKKSGGIDLQFLGLGRDGHIAFNEPGSSFKSRTRLVKLHEMTRKDNSRAFASLRSTPTHALTVGIATILSARRIVLIATGVNKAKSIKKLIENSPSINLPASALCKHRDTLLILDRAAASQLKREL